MENWYQALKGEIDLAGQGIFNFQGLFSVPFLRGRPTEAAAQQVHRADAPEFSDRLRAQ
jgi:hypothetical protein